jgi:hypothetical protein
MLDAKGQSSGHDKANRGDYYDLPLVPKDDVKDVTQSHRGSRPAFLFRTIHAFTLDLLLTKATPLCCPSNKNWTPSQEAVPPIDRLQSRRNREL